MPPTVGFPPAKEGMEDEEGFFTCAVSVQHKVNIFTIFPILFFIFVSIFFFLLKTEANLLLLWFHFEHFAVFNLWEIVAAAVFSSQKVIGGKIFL